MTAQSSDIFLYEGEQYELAGESGDFHFHPEDHGITLGKDRTASDCWHGYICTYEVKDNQLYLKDLHTIATPTGTLNGIEVSTEGYDPDDPEFYYRSVNFPIHYTGGLLIAQEAVDCRLEYMGFSPAWNYETVVELIFEDGKLQKAHNASDPAAEYRMKFINKHSPPSFDEVMEGSRSYMDWIEETFTLKYK